MAHRLGRADEADSLETRDEKSDDGSDKLLLNRRKYVKLGAAAATLFGASSLTNASAADSSGQTYYNDFSGGKL